MQEAMRLYSSAIDKLEKVLAMQPDNVAALVTCGLALKDMALCMQPEDPDTLINLEVTLFAKLHALCNCMMHVGTFVARLLRRVAMTHQHNLQK